MSKIGENIRKMRELNGLTQEELARRMGYKSKSTINKIESGINDIPQSKIIKFAECLNTSPSVLMGWVNENTSKKNDDLVKIIALLRKDKKFYESVHMLAELPEEQRDSFATIISALGKK